MVAVLFQPLRERLEKAIAAQEGLRGSLDDTILDAGCAGWNSEAKQNQQHAPLSLHDGRRFDDPERGNSKQEDFKKGNELEKSIDDLALILRFHSSGQHHRDHNPPICYYRKRQTRWR
jgi:hypothetical protein